MVWRVCVGVGGCVCACVRDGVCVFVCECVVRARVCRNNNNNNNNNNNEFIERFQKLKALCNLMKVKHTSVNIHTHKSMAYKSIPML